jgi:glycosyltransferase 2 family protein
MAMPPKIQTLLRYVLSFLIAFGFLYLAFRGIKFSDLMNSLKGVNYWYVALLIPIVLLSHWARAVRWAYLLAPVKPKMSMRNLFSGVMIGYAVNNVLPRVGELVRPYVLGRLEHISRTSALATVVVERILDMLSFYFLACVVIFLYPHSLDPFISNAESTRPLFLAGCIVLMLVFLFLFFKVEAFFRFLTKLLRFIPQRYRVRIESILDSFYAGFAVAKQRDKFFVVLLWSFAIWGLYALGMYEPFFAFHALVKPELNIGAAVVLLVISSASWILPAPGAIGTYHAFLTVAMVRLYGVDPITALSYSIVTHEVGYLIVMIIGGYFYFKDQLKVSEFSAETQQTE